MLENMSRIKQNVQRMAEMGAPEEDIDGYIASENVSIDDVRNFNELDLGEAAKPLVSNQFPTIDKTKSPVDNAVGLAKTAQYAIDPMARVGDMAGNIYDQMKSQFVNRPEFRKVHDSLSDKPIINAPGKNIIPFGLSPAMAAGEKVLRNLSPRKISETVGPAAVDVGATMATDAIGPLAKGASRIMKGVGNGVEEAGGRAMNFYLKPGKAQYKFGKSPGRGVVKHISGPSISRESLGGKVESKLSELMANLEKKASESKQPVEITPFFNEINKMVGEMSALPRTYEGDVQTHKNFVLDIIDNIKSIAKTDGKGKIYLEPKEAVNLKRLVGKIPNWSANDPKLGTLTKSVRQGYGALDKEIDRSLPGSAELNADISDLIGAKRSIDDGVMREQNKHGLGIIDWGVGGLFGHGGGPQGILTGALASKAMRSAPAITTAGAMAGKVAKGARNISGVLDEVEGPRIMQSIRKALGNEPKELATIPTPAPEYGPNLLERNRRSEISRQLPDFSSKPTIDIEGSSTIELPEVPDTFRIANEARLEKEFGVPSGYAPPRSVTKEEDINKASNMLPSFLQKLLKRRGIR